ETEIRGRIRGFIEAVVEEELQSLLSRGHYGRRPAGAAGTGVAGHRHGHRNRTLRGTFGEVTVELPRARLVNPDGTTTEWQNATIPAYKRRTRQVDALIASAYLSGTNTRRVRRALGALFARGVGKDVVSRTWRKIQTDWNSWGKRSLQDEPMVRLILDGTVHKHRNLLAHAPDKLHEELSADYTDMMYAKTPLEVEKRRKSFLRKWRIKCRPVADSLEEAGDRLFTFTRFPDCQWKSLRTTNAIERLHEEFKRRIKTQTVLPSSDTAAMLFWALVASGQVILRKVDGWQTLAVPATDK